MTFRFKGFTLLELLVVMGVIALITGMGIYGLVRFQSNTKVQTTFNDVVSLLKTMQNNARNSISFQDASSLTPNICTSGGNCVPDYFGIKFSSTNYDVYGCLKSGPDNIICADENRFDTTGIGIPDVTISYIGTQCDYVVFERLTGDIADVIGNPTWIKSGNTTCAIRVSNIYGDSRTVEINLVTNSIRDAGV